jgi:ADP-ribose pyrophosphatase
MMDYKNLEEKTLSRKDIFKGHIIDVHVDEVLLPNGNKSFREVVDHVDGVAVLALDADNNVMMVTQYRYVFGRNLLEIPAGKLERGEDPYPAALRELREETGGYTDRLEYLGDYYGSAGFCDEKLTLYFARLEQIGQTDPDEDEFLTVERYSLPVFEAMIARGEIVDGKTLSAYTLAKARRLI